MVEETGFPDDVTSASSVVTGFRALNEGEGFLRQTSGRKELFVDGECYLPMSREARYSSGIANLGPDDVEILEVGRTWRTVGLSALWLR